MNVLFIPFKGDTDLLNAAKQWAKVRCDDNIKIIQYGDSLHDFGCDTINVYILAHGTRKRDDNYYFFSHRSKRVPRKSLSIDEISERFQEYFYFHKENIDAIHLYFCNEHASERDVASRFKKTLYRFDRTRVNYYKGALLIPQKNAWFAKHKGKKKQIKDVLSSLMDAGIIDYRNDKMKSKRFIHYTTQERDRLFWLYHAKKNARSRFYRSCKKSRLERFDRNRGIGVKR